MEIIGERPDVEGMNICESSAMYRSIWAFVLFIWLLQGCIGVI